MAIIPACDFDLRIPEGHLVAGGPVEMVLKIGSYHPVPRAKRVLCRFESEAVVEWLSQSEHRVRQGMVEHEVELPLPDGLPEGAYELPLVFPSLPDWLPPTFELGRPVMVSCAVDVRVDVDWAPDPTARLAFPVVMPPRRGVRSPVIERSPASFHRSLGFEVTLASSVIRPGERIEGAIALRAGADARFDAVQIDVVSELSASLDHRMGRCTDRTEVASVFLMAEELRKGRAVPFSLRPKELLPSFDNRFVRHKVFVVVTADVPWARDPSFAIPIEVLPSGSAIEGSARAAVIGKGRIERLAAAVAAETGLREAAPPALVEGAEGPVDIRLVDVAEGASFGVATELSYPDLGLGLSLRPRGRREDQRSPLVPAPFAGRFVLSYDDAWRSERDQAALSEFLHAVLADIDPESDVRLTDGLLAHRVATDGDRSAEVVAIARAARERAKAIARAIPKLPFRGPAAARATWEAVAAERSAFLLPTGPSLDGILLGARTLVGEERVLRIRIDTVWQKDTARTQVIIDLGDAPLPAEARAQLASAASHERLHPVRAVFSRAKVDDSGREVVLDADTWAADPRTLIPALEAFLDFVLDVRGERRAVAAYR